MAARLLQYFFLALLCAFTSVQAEELQPGNVYQLTFADVDRHQLSTADGHITIVTVMTRKDEQKAQAVGDRVPRYCFGDPKYRLITVVNFQQKMFSPLHGMISAIIRRRLDTEAKGLQKIYTAKRLTRNPREDIYVVADFDGQVASKLGIEPLSSEFGVFVFDGRGRLVKRWNDPPSTEELDAALAEAR